MSLKGPSGLACVVVLVCDYSEVVCLFGALPTWHWALYLPGWLLTANDMLLCALFCSADRAFLKKWKWSQMMLDEAHALKNANSQRSRRLRKLAASCRGRVMLTGMRHYAYWRNCRVWLQLLQHLLFDKVDVDLAGQSS